MKHIFTLRKTLALATLLILSVTALARSDPAYAQTSAVQQPSSGEFSLQVSPSPLIHTVEPGETKEMEVKIRNNGDRQEELKIEPRSFKVSADGEDIELNDTPPDDVKDWISFSEPRFTLIPGQEKSQKVRVNVPKDAGFSYAFALVISRQRDPVAVKGGQAIKGSLALFTLINVDRPGAVRKLEISKFSMNKRVYEYLPAELTITFKNTGNTIAQPYGDVFFLRTPGDTKQLGNIPVNDKRGYILPGTSRTLKVQWDDGFPVYRQVEVETGKTETRLDWNWGNAANTRIGKYTAQVVAIYNDGKRDVPIEGTISFWVIPWKILLGITLIVLLVAFSVGSVIWRVVRYSRRRHKSRRYSG
jgi:hypothetical protein